jgi:hypothetical protein
MRKYQVLSSLAIFAVGFALSAIVDGWRLASLAQGTQSNSPAPAVAAPNTRQPAALQKWEYKSVYSKKPLVDGEILKLLNELGEEGYEVCGMGQSQGDGAFGNKEYSMSIVLRRPK